PIGWPSCHGGGFFGVFDGLRRTSGPRRRKRGVHQQHESCNLRKSADIVKLKGTRRTPPAKNVSRIGGGYFPRHLWLASDKIHTGGKQNECPGESDLRERRFPPLAIGRPAGTAGSDRDHRGPRRGGQAGCFCLGAGSLASLLRCPRCSCAGDSRAA